MTLYDLTLPLSPVLPVWEGDPPIEITRVVDMAAGEDYNLTRMRMSAHAGTHVDAPLHFHARGASVETLPLETMVGPAVVLELNTGKDITAADLEAAHLPPGTLRLLCKTRNGRLWDETPGEFRRDFTGIAEDAARWLVEHGVRLVGIDYLSIESYPSLYERGSPVHRYLLAEQVVIVEGLDLRAVPPGPYTLLCLPLKLVGGDGAPARVVLWDSH